MKYLKKTFKKIIFARRYFSKSLTENLDFLYSKAMKLHSPSSVYEIKKTLSKGSSCGVFLAERKNKNYSIRQKVILKLFSSRSKIYPLELGSLIQVRSPYCVKVLHFELIENKPALILEWVEGLNLVELKQSFPLTEEEVSFICRQIQRGLLDLKTAGLCHGDISPSNVLVDKKGQVLLIDFGKGNYMGDNVFSTPSFTAPEVLQGQKPNFLSDLFSLGRLEQSLLKTSLKPEPPQFLGLAGDPLLDPSPLNRKLKNFKTLEKTKNLLAQKVLQGLESKPRLNAKTQVIANKQKTKSFWPGGLYLTALLYALSAGGQKSENSFGSLTVRSHQWLYLQIAGKKGFSPFSSGPLPPGVYHLKWKSQNRQGQKMIEIKKDSHLLLAEKEFYL